MTGVKEFPENTSQRMAVDLLNTWNTQTVANWDLNDHHYIYWME